MADVTNELIYEVLKQVQHDVSLLKTSNGDIKSELNAIRNPPIAMQQDIHNIYPVLDGHDRRFERIERRLEILEPAK